MRSLTPCEDCIYIAEDNCWYQGQMVEDQSLKHTCKKYHPKWMMHYDHTQSFSGITNGEPLATKGEHGVSVSGAQNMGIVACEVFVFHFE